MSQAAFSFVETERPNRLGALGCLNDLGNTEEIFRRLSSVDWAFTDEPTAYLSHDIHPYPAKFIPQIPQQLIAQLSVCGDLVWDPFGGCGTTALEAILLGRCALSTDVNPLGKIIGEAKTLTLRKEEEEGLNDFIEQLLLLSANRSRLINELKEYENGFSMYIPAIPNLEEWFHQQSIHELAFVRWRIEKMHEGKAQKLAKAAFSKSILKASFQDGETRYARKPRDVKAGSVIGLFAENLFNALKKVKQLGSLLRFREAEFKTIDLRKVRISDSPDNNAESLLKNSVDLIVTSPPYPNTTDYHLYHRFRLFWLGFDPRELARKEMGSHLRHQKERTGFESYIEEMSLCLDTMKRVLRPGRYAAMIIGSGVFSGKIYDSAWHLRNVAKNLGFEIVGTIDRQVHASKRSFISPARRLKAETLLVLRKPECSVKLTLFKAPYKLWPYEEVLRKKEVQSVTGKIPTEIGNDDYSVRINALQIDKIRRLTFTHGFRATEIGPTVTWQGTLEKADPFNSPSNRKDPKYATHGIHAYKGKFYPQLAKCLFNLAGIGPGQIVLDPFCGSGTVLLEAYLNGLRGIGTDTNLLAIKIARVKTEILEIDPYLRDRVLSRFENRLDTLSISTSAFSVFAESSRNELMSWFPDQVLLKLAALLETIQEVSDPCVRDLLEVLTSSIVRDISQQDPKDLRIRRRHEPLTDAPVFELFRQRLNEVRQRLQRFSENGKSAPHRFEPARALLGDSRSMQTFTSNGVTDGSVDIIITSPPYATALPYIDTDRLSILLLFGLTARERVVIEESLIGNREIGRKTKMSVEREIDRDNFDPILSRTARSIIVEVRERNARSNAGFRRQNMAALLYLYFADMSLVMNNMNSLLKPGATAFFIIGNNWTTAEGKLIEIKSTESLKEIGLSLGWKLLDSIPITVTTENKRHSRNSITKNEIVWFKKIY